MMTLFNFASQKGEPETAPSDNPKRSPKKGRRLWNRDDKSSEESTSSTQAPSYSPVKVALSEETIHGSETEIGIEISLDWDALVEQGEEEEEMNVPVVNGKRCIDLSSL
jgi:cytoskeletal protein RodZ